MLCLIGHQLKYYFNSTQVSESSAFHPHWNNHLSPELVTSRQHTLSPQSLLTAPLPDLGCLSVFLF